jgi:NTP pyrophosphatase (non-canonical NTP hydrolase)
VTLTNALTFHELRKKNTSRCLRWHPGGLSDWSLSDWAVAATGELGEALNVLKKLNRERDGIIGNTEAADVLRMQFADELADTVIYLDLLAAAAGIDLEIAITQKFNRTSQKVGFPERLP